MKAHELKTAQPYFDMVATGKKKFELRKNDRGFQTGDVLILHEIQKGGNYNGNDVAVRVIGILQDYPGLEDGYCILSISDLF